MLPIIIYLALVVIVFALVMTVAPQGWRTVIFNAVAGIPLVGAQIADMLGGFDWTKVFDGKAAAWAGLAVVVLNVALRAMTSTPMGKAN